MWHTIEPQHQFYDGRKINGDRSPLLKDAYREVDQQIAGLLKLAASDSAIMVFALHGMRPAFGFPSFLGPLLCERGFSRLESWTSQSWNRRALSLLASAKRTTPDSLKNLYYKLTPTATTHKLARPTMLPVYDWKTTRAFSLPTDQYGWIRVNLAGREAQGIVSVNQYDETCGQLEDLLLALTTEDGESLVHDLTRTAGSAASALSNPLPDLVVHWEDSAFASPLRIKNSKVRAEPVGKKSTGQHASEGFCIYRGNDLGPSKVVAAKDLGKLMISGLTKRSGQARLPDLKGIPAGPVFSAGKPFNWKLQFKNDDPKTFYDAMSLGDRNHGIVIGDSIDGHFCTMTTENGGQTWVRVAASALAPALENEGSFAGFDPLSFAHGRPIAYAAGARGSIGKLTFTK